MKVDFIVIIVIIHVSLDAHSNSVRYVPLLPPSPRNERLRLREGKHLSQGHTANMQ